MTKSSFKLLFMLGLSILCLFTTPDTYAAGSPVSVTVLNVQKNSDNSYSPIIGGKIKVQNHTNWRNVTENPYQVILPSGAKRKFFSQWNFLMASKKITIRPGNIYRIDAKSKVLEIISMPGVSSRVEFVYKPIFVQVDNMKPDGNGGFSRLRDGLITVSKIVTRSDVSNDHYSFSFVDGGTLKFFGSWGSNSRNKKITINEGYIYQINVKTGLLNSFVSNSGITRVEFVFNPLLVSVSNVKKNTDGSYSELMGGEVKVAKVSDWINTLEGPFSFTIPDGAKNVYFGRWGFLTKQRKIKVEDGKIYRFLASTGELLTPVDTDLGTARVEIVFNPVEVEVFNVKKGLNNTYISLEAGENKVNNITQSKME